MWQEEIEGKDSKTVIIRCHIILAHAHVFILLLVKAEQENILNTLLLLDLLSFQSLCETSNCVPPAALQKPPQQRGSPATNMPPGEPGHLGL